jgi:DNA-binding MarR family transcriptional regulator
LYVDELREQQLTQGEAHILALLAESSPLTVGDLHRGLAHKRSTLTSILDRLTERGLIARKVGESDRRTFVVTLTSGGRKLALRVSRHLTSLERQVRRQVNTSDIKGFQKVIAALEREAAQTEENVQVSTLSVQHSMQRKRPRRRFASPKSGR